MDQQKSTASLRQYLKASGYSFTKQRRMVFDCLILNHPIAMHELLIKLNDSMDPVSVYRTIDLFEKLNIVQRINFGWKYKLELTDNFVNHHHHLLCLGCGKVININQAEIETFIGYTAAKQGFLASSHQLEIQGYCRSCLTEAKKTVNRRVV